MRAEKDLGAVSTISISLEIVVFGTRLKILATTEFVSRSANCLVLNGP